MEWAVFSSVRRKSCSLFCFEQGLVPWWADFSTVTLIGQASHLWHLIFSCVYLPPGLSPHWALNKHWLSELCTQISKDTGPCSTTVLPVWGCRAQGGGDGAVWMGRGFTRTTVLSPAFPSLHFPGTCSLQLSQQRPYRSQLALYLLSKVCPLYTKLAGSGWPCLHSSEFWKDEDFFPCGSWSPWPVGMEPWKDKRPNWVQGHRVSVHDSQS